MVHECYRNASKHIPHMNANLQSFSADVKTSFSHVVTKVALKNSPS